MATAKVHREPGGSGVRNTKIRWLGKRNKYGQRYMTRNCFFEPSTPGKDWVDTCLHEIATAFRWRKPAIISSHRVNYIGALEESNRDHGLLKLRELLDSIIRRWPETEFVSSDQLGQMIEGEV